MKRRVLLSALGCGTLSLAGCTTSRSRKAALTNVIVVNGRSQATQVEVSIDKNGTTRYRNTHLITGQDADDNAIEITRDWLGERVPYSVTVEVVHGTATETYSTSDAEADVSDWGTDACFDTVFTVDPSDVRVSIGSNESC